MAMTMRGKRMRAIAVATGLTLVLAACGDDGDDPEEATDTTEAPAEGEAAGDVEEFCAALAELDSQQGPPTAEQMENLKEIRPDEVGESVDTVADAIIAADGDIGAAFGDPAVEEGMGAIEAFEVDACGVEPDEGGDEELVFEPAEGHTIVPIEAGDYTFGDVPATLAAGPTAFEFTNGGEAEHELILVKLGEGAVLDELLASEEEPSEEEAQMIGATFASPGDPATYINAELEPGTYAMVCFIPGPEGKPHFEHGMKTTFEVE